MHTAQDPSSQEPQLWRRDQTEAAQAAVNKAAGQPGVGLAWSPVGDSVPAKLEEKKRGHISLSPTTLH